MKKFFLVTIFIGCTIIITDYLLAVRKIQQSFPAGLSTMAKVNGHKKQTTVPRK